MVVFAEDPNGPQLPRFYANREIFITGATGFMGKVLVERLLSTCPDVGRLHLLMRVKRGQPPEKRLEQLKQSPVFHNIRLQCPFQLDKLVAVPGDITEAQLGLDVNAIAALKEVSVVFHNAATTKFIEPLRDAVSQNILSAINVMDVCDKLPELEALVHVSTAFTNTELPHIEERVYDMSVKLQHLLVLLDTHTSEEVEKMTLRLIQPKLNTYFFTKALAEIAVAQRQHRDYSVTIFRPSIVISAHQAPFPGWIDGYSGLTGIVVCSGQGLMRVTQFIADYTADVVPVDVAIDNMIAVGWETAMERPVAAQVYYCGSQEHPLLWSEIHAEVQRSAVRHPMDNVLYYPFSFVFSNRYIYKAFEVLLQTMPLHLAAYVSKICGIKQPICLKTVAQRLSIMTALLSNISCSQWTFSCHNMRRLREKLHKTDGHLFYLDIRDLNWQEHLANYHRGARKFVLKQKDETLPRAKKHMNRLRLIHYVFQLVLMLLGCKLFMSLIPKIYQLGNRLLLLSMLQNNSRLKRT